MLWGSPQVREPIQGRWVAVQADVPPTPPSPAQECHCLHTHGMEKIPLESGGGFRGELQMLSRPQSRSPLTTQQAKPKTT